MLRPLIDIEICREADKEKIKLDFAIDVQIVSSYEDVTDVAMIKLPRNIGVNSAKYADLTKFLEVGSKVDIRLGYEEFSSDNEVIDFTGYIAEVNIAESHISIRCEDAMWLLKQYSITANFKDIDLSEMVEFILPKSSVISSVAGTAGNEVITSFPSAPSKLESTRKSKKLGTYYKVKGDEIVPDNLVTVADAKIGDWEIKNNANLVEVIDGLKRKFPFYGFIDPYHSLDAKPIIHIGLPYAERASTAQSDRRTCVFSFGRNIIKSNLKYQRLEDYKVKIIAVSLIPIKGTDSNKKIEVEAGDSFGDTIKLNYYNITDEKKLKELAENELQKRRFTGYRGDFLTFGAPIIRHGDKITVEDDGENGISTDGTKSTYRVKRVVYKSGNKGFKQQVFLDYRIDE